MSDTMQNKLTSILNLSSPDQIGVVVEDVEAAASRLQALLGIGPCRIIDWPLEGIDPEATLRGQPAYWRMRMGFIDMGHISIELVEPVEGDSHFREFLEQHGPGLHHLRFLVDDFAKATAALETHGIPMLASGTGAHVGSRWAFFDTSKVLDGVMIELRQRLSNEDAWLAEGKVAG